MTKYNHYLMAEDMSDLEEDFHAFVEPHLENNPVSTIAFLKMMVIELAYHMAPSSVHAEELLRLGREMAMDRLNN